MLIFSECDVTRVGRLAERRYQLAAQRRNDTALKFEYYVQTANYFERECGKVRQFNSWNTGKLKPTHWENIKKLESLRKRRNKLEELLKAENENYKREIEELNSRKSVREEITLEALKEKLRQKRTEHSLYHPRTCRRIQSYFSYPTQVERAVLKELSNPVTRKSTRMSLENTNLRNDTREPEVAKENISTKKAVDLQNAMDQENFNIRAQQCRDNRSAQLRSNIGSNLAVKPQQDSSNSRQCNSGSSTRVESSELLSHSAGTHQTISGWHMQKKYADRYATRSLQNTNVSDTAGKAVTSTGPEDIPDHSAPDTAPDKDNQDVVYSKTFDEKCNEEGLLVDELAALHVSPSSDISQAINDTPKNPDIMLMYLAHKELQKKIEDLQNREHWAIQKHSWEEALRFKEMRNRLELLRDKQFYERDDINVDPEIKKLALKSIKLRSQQLADREKFCVNERMYSEEAKLIWNTWAEEDKKCPVRDEKHEREVLLRQLEEEWKLLDDEDKQRISYKFHKIMTDSFLQHELELLTKISNQKLH